MPNLSNISLFTMWQFVLAISVATGIIFYILRRLLGLGVKTILTWDSAGLKNIYKENGWLRVIWSLALLVFCFRQTLYIFLLWVTAIGWTLGYVTPPSN